MGSAGSVRHQFDRKGHFSVPAKGADEDTLMGIALDAGADDMKREGDTFEITCDPASFNKVKEALAAGKVEVAASEITQLPKVYVDTDTETAKKVLRLIEAIDDHDDVQNVYSNLHLTEKLMAEVAKE